MHLTKQRLTRNFTGYGVFKHRIRLEGPGPNGMNYSEFRVSKHLLELRLSEHLTREYGYGPYIDDAKLYAREVAEPRWGHKAEAHYIYVADPEVMAEVEKFLLMPLLQYSN